MANSERPDDEGGGETDESTDPSVLHLSPDEREQRGIDDDEVRAAFVEVLRSGDAERKDLRGVDLPALELDRMTVEGVDRHPVDLRDATVESLSVTFSAVRLPLVLDGATLGELRLDESRFTEELSLSGATVTGDVSAVETEFRGDLVCEGATFEGDVDFDEVVCTNDVAFDDARFEGAVRARAGEFYGDSNLLDDNTSFTDAVFGDGLDVRETEFGFTHFEGVLVEGVANFQEATFDGDADFDGATFRGVADFDEVRFDGDAAFEGVAFHDRAAFRGATFAGGARALDDDVAFVGARFHDEATFDHALFRYANFTGASFDSRAGFQEVRMTADADFPDVTFAGDADFDEARFEADADFSGVVFQAGCAFRGVEFEGGANYLEDDVSFEGARFGADADFHNAEISSANFLETSFAGTVDFSDSRFTDRIDFEAGGEDDGAFVDFTRAKIRSGLVRQPAGSWVRYDMTRASLGDVELAASADEDYRRLLDYFRFCRTEFDEFDGHTFDFSSHRDYLDRNGWAIHAFHDPGGDHEYALEMTPEVIEETYLRAKQAATTDGDVKVAGEFRVKRQQYSRYKNLEVARDPETGAWARLKNFGRAAENYFLGVTCGHGMRPMRIGAAFLVAPLFYVPFYALGGPLFRTSAAGGAQVASLGQLLSSEGARVLFENARFSYISYTTIGYGFIGPEGPAAEVLAASEAYLGVVLSALLVYALVKRSEL